MKTESIEKAIEKASMIESAVHEKAKKLQQEFHAFYEMVKENKPDINDIDVAMCWIYKELAKIKIGI